MPTVDTDLLRAGMNIQNVTRQLGFGNDWSRLAGLSILDLGCGSRLTPRYLNPDGWPPFFCLLASNLGAHVTGIDLHAADKQDAKVYTHIRADLVAAVHTDSLENIGLPTGSFHVVHAGLLTSTDPPSGDFIAALEKHHLSEQQFKDELLGSLSRLLVPGGVWVENGDYKQMK